MHASHVDMVEKKRAVEDEQKEEQAVEVTATASADQQQQQQHKSSSPSSSVPHIVPVKPVKSFLSRIAAQRLQLPFQVKDRNTSFLISAYVPGIDEETLSIALNDEGDLLTCTGDFVCLFVCFLFFVLVGFVF
jgi:hypothetical protein